MKIAKNAKEGTEKNLLCFATFAMFVEKIRGLKSRADDRLDVVALRGEHALERGHAFLERETLDP